MWRSRMKFESILFLNTADRIADNDARAPDFFVDLNLNQIVTAVVTGKEDYALAPFFSMPLHDVDAVLFRHEIFQDLEDPALMRLVRAFAKDMRAVRDHLVQAEKRYNRFQKMRWFFDAVDLYGRAVQRLTADLTAMICKSRGISALKDYVTQYTASQLFISLRETTEALTTELSAIRYSVLLQGLRVEIRHYNGEPDYSKEIEATFARFAEGAGKTYTFELGDSPDLDNVEGNILNLVAQLHHDTFAKLEAYCVSNKDFLDDTIGRFDREVEFYIAYLDHIATLKREGLFFCYPRVSGTQKDICALDSFDLALAGKLAREHAVPVCNDFQLTTPERVIVVSGPNQGGKTTFARTFGQMHYLASLGCPVPGAEAQLFLPDRLFTHFEREERMASLRGKLQDDLIRIHNILEVATPRSIIVINEIFASTTLRDALSLSKKIAGKIIALDIPCVWVTFLEEVASLSEKTVSMVSTVVPEKPEQRTFEIVRRAADGLAYAMSVAEKYRLTYAQIIQRAQS
jgi:DNA mismatch repair protein MutS